MTEAELARELPRIRGEVDEIRRSLQASEVRFAVINTKLNVVIGVLSTVGVALTGVLVKMIF